MSDSEDDGPPVFTDEETIMATAAASGTGATGAIGAATEPEPEPEPDFESDIEQDYEEEPRFVSDFKQIGHTSFVGGGPIGGFFEKEENEIILFRKNMEKITIPLGEQYEEQPSLTRLLSNYPHPRFLNPELCFIVSFYFIEGWSQDQKTNYNNIKKYNRDVASRYHTLKKIADYTLPDTQDNKKLNSLSIQHHDIFRYCTLFSMNNR